MQMQGVIRDTLDLFHNDSLKHLIAIQAAAHLLSVFNIASKILPDDVGNDRVRVEEVFDRFKFFGPRVVYGSDHQGHLIVFFLCLSGRLLS